MTGKGKRRRQLRIISQIQLSAAEANALSDVFADLEQHAIVTGILGGVLVEHQLDSLLRRRFKRRDESTWEQLVGENGPLRSFHTKIVTGYAMGIYDEAFRDDLNIVRTIRNTFAHSRQLLDFNNDLICDELGIATHVHKAVKRHFRVDKSKASAKAAYVSLCYGLTLKLLQKEARAQRARSRAKSKLNDSPVLRALMAGYTPQSRRGLTSLLPPTDQSEGPMPQSRLGEILGLVQLVPKADDSTDK